MAVFSKPTGDRNAFLILHSTFILQRLDYLGTYFLLSSLYCIYIRTTAHTEKNSIVDSQIANKARDTKLEAGRVINGRKKTD